MEYLKLARGAWKQMAVFWDLSLVTLQSENNQAKCAIQNTIEKHSAD